MKARLYACCETFHQQGHEGFGFRRSHRFFQRQEELDSGAHISQHRSWDTPNGGRKSCGHAACRKRRAMRRSKASRDRTGFTSTHQIGAHESARADRRTAGTP